MDVTTSYACDKRFDAPFGEIEQAKTVIMVMDPIAALGVIGNAELTEIAMQVRARMERVLTALSQRN